MHFLPHRRCQSKKTTLLTLRLQITGDDTPVLQAVLDADVWRKHLLLEQDVSIGL